MFNMEITFKIHSIQNTLWLLFDEVKCVKEFRIMCLVCFDVILMCFSPKLSVTCQIVILVDSNEKVWHKSLLIDDLLWTKNRSRKMK